MIHAPIDLRRTTLILKVFFLLMLGFSIAPLAWAQEVNITQDLPYFEFDNGHDFIVVERNQDPNGVIPEFYTRTGRPCPPFCVQPMSAGDGVTTIGELELIAFLDEHVKNGTGFLIDARLSNWFAAGTIPGAVNISFPVFENPETNPFMVPFLTNLGGAQLSDGTWDFEDAKELALFCNGPWCGQPARAINDLLQIGYPAEKLRYYRAGMQGWESLGLTVHVPPPLPKLN